MNYAFALIHFGSNPVYLELELFFCKMLRHYTHYDILYLYSSDDTPLSFVKAMSPLVTKTVPFSDRKITYDVPFSSGYTNFNTLRTCDFIFAYTLTHYDKVCIIESDMVLMKSIDDIFSLHCPAVLTYYIGDSNIKYNRPVHNNKITVLKHCGQGGRLNGGVMLIKPSNILFQAYKQALPEIIQHQCKYPNETLFEYVNNQYYNLPVQYNLSHYHTKKLGNYRLQVRDIRVYHFNETKFKHLDIVANPIDEHGENWLEKIQILPKYNVRKLPILHYATFYKKYHPEISRIMQSILHSKSKSISKSKSSSKSKKKRCPRGSRRNKHTGKCDIHNDKTNQGQTKRCPRGSRRNKHTGNCDTKY
jgi:hypothetical protein